MTPGEILFWALLTIAGGIAVYLAAVALLAAFAASLKVRRWATKQIRNELTDRDNVVS